MSLNPRALKRTSYLPDGNCLKSNFPSESVFAEVINFGSVSLNDRPFRIHSGLSKILTSAPGKGDLVGSSTMPRNSLTVYFLVTVTDICWPEERLTEHSVRSRSQAAFIARLV